jgi:endogenous inhibitor of DNA gyrase (YacG/DUF329 family)
MARIITCRCGRKIECLHFTNTCVCGADYNHAGQRLAPRSQWGEETGESWSECLGDDYAGEGVNVIEDDYHDQDMREQNNSTCPDCGQEEEYRGDYDDFMDYECGIDFADPGGHSALRAVTRDNPRNQPCPTCGAENVLTPADVSLGYQCDRCADQAERGW